LRAIKLSYTRKRVGRTNNEPRSPFAGDRINKTNMAYANLLFHIVFGTKGRLPLIRPEISTQFYAYLSGVVRGLGGMVLTRKGTIRNSILGRNSKHF